MKLAKRGERPPAHYLEPLRGEPKRVNFLTFDIESKDGDSERPGFTRVFLATVCGADKLPVSYANDNDSPWKTAAQDAGGCIDQSMRYMLQSCFSGYWIYAHAGGTFDFLHVLPWLEKNAEHMRLNWEVIPIGSSILCLRVKQGDCDKCGCLASEHVKENEDACEQFTNRKGKNWTFLDSYRLMPKSLSALTDAFKVTRKMQFDLATPSTEKKAWAEYNQIDCIALYEVLEKFHGMIVGTLGGEVGITAPSTAMKTFRRKYLEDDLHRNIRHHAFIRESYCGGRTEVERFTAPDGDWLCDVKYYDFNSCYPSVMRRNMPVGKAQMHIGPPGPSQKGKIGFARVRVYLPDDCRNAPLPVRISGKLCFPVGTFEGVFCSIELDLVQRAGGRILHWGKSVWFESRPVFTEMVEDLYPYRDKTLPGYDSAIAEIVKILLNSLYGKFGQKTLRQRIIPARLLATVNPIEAVPVDEQKQYYRVTEETDAPYVIPQVSAAVTSYARRELWEARQKVIELGGENYYSDTDSLVCNVKLPSSSELGALKDEYPGKCIDMLFLGPKCYAIRSDVTIDGTSKFIVKAKGIPKALRTPEGFEKLRWRVRLDFELLEKVGILARLGFARGPRMRKVHKTVHEDVFGKRQRLPDGGTRPLIIEKTVRHKTGEYEHFIKDVNRDGVRPGRVGSGHS